MADPLIDLGRYQLRLSALRANTVSRRQHLEPLYRSGGVATCLCSTSGVPMGIANRSSEPALFYLYHLHRPDPLRHSVTCPNRVELAEALTQAQPAAPAAPPAPPPPPALPHQLPVVASHAVVRAPVLQPRLALPQKADPEPAGMSGLLDTLFKVSGLNTWKPAFLGHRSYFQVRYRVIEAAKRISPIPGATLADMLYVPPLWDPARRDDINFEWETFLSLLAPNCEGSVPRGVVFGLVRGLEFRPQWTAPALRLADFRDRFWLDNVPDLLPHILEPGDRWAVLLAVELNQQNRRPVVVDAAATRVSAQWIPVFSRAHAELADRFVDSGQAFTAPLASDRTTAWAVPDFVLRIGAESFIEGPTGRRSLRPRDRARVG